MLKCTHEDANLRHIEVGDVKVMMNTSFAADAKIQADICFSSSR